jgi:uncharacterized protein YjbI with pentapeptide repeats
MRACGLFDRIDKRIQAIAEQHPQLRWAWLAGPITRRPRPEPTPSSQGPEREKESTDELDRTIQRTVLALVAFALFSLLVVMQPDSELLVTSEKVKVPFADTLADYVQFLLVGQLIMIALATYLHVHMEAAASIPYQGQRLPVLHNQKGVIAIILSIALTYILPLITVCLFAWKSLPIKLSLITLPLSAAFATSLLFVMIRRVPYHFRPLAVPLLLVLITLVAFNTVRDVLGRLDSIAWPREYDDPRLSALMGASRKACDANDGRFRRTVNFRGVDFRGKDLAARDLSGFDLSGANLSGINLSESRLCGARLERADLSHSMLAGARLSRAWMYLASLEGADLQSAALDGAMLWDTDLRGVNFLKADLRRADLREAGLSCINYSVPNLECTSAEEANFDGTNLASADIRNMDFSKAKGLTCEQVRGAHGWDQAKGTIIEECKRTQ